MVSQFVSINRAGKELRHRAHDLGLPLLQHCVQGLRQHGATGEVSLRVELGCGRAGCRAVADCT